MNQKENYYPLFTQNSSAIESSAEDIAAAKKAYETFSNAFFNDKEEKVIITHEENPIELETILGKGGAKLVFDLHNGYAVGLLNIRSNPIDIQMWNRLIKEEVAVSQKLRQLGLCTQAYEEAILYFDGYPTKVLKMPTFDSLATQGQQVRDIKNKHRSGTSLIFENQANLQNPEHWKKILQGLQEDLVIYYSQNLEFGRDTFNLAIVDSPETPTHDRTALALFTERKQKVRFCFYDFSSKYCEYREAKYDFLNSDVNFDKKRLEEEIDGLFIRVVSVIIAGVLPIEYVNILGGIHTLLLLSEDTAIKEIPEKTIVLKKMENGAHYAYFMDNGILKEKKIGKINAAGPDPDLELTFVLFELAKKFPSPGEMERKISINEDEKTVQKIASKCIGHKQYSSQGCVLDIGSLAKPAIEEVKPLFIKAVADGVMEKLAQLSPEERQNKFKVDEPSDNEQKCTVR